MNTIHIILCFVVFIATLISIYYILHFLGFIPKTIPYFLRVYSNYLNSVECHNFKNISYLLKYFGYLDNTISLNKITDSDINTEEEEQREQKKNLRKNNSVNYQYEYSIYMKGRRKFQKDYEKLLSDFETQKKIALLNERHKEICSCKESEYILF